MSYIHPGAEAVSEFARQVALGNILLPGVQPQPVNIAPGQYLRGTCVEASAYMLAVASGKLPKLPPAEVGDELQGMVDEWRAHDPSVALNGSSNYTDAAWWLRGLGLTVDDSVASDATAAYKEMVANIPLGYVYLVGTCDAQMLPGDEAGVHCHGLAALGLDDAGNIVCGDPDNARAQQNMPGNPYGGLVSYDLGNLIAAGVTSLTRVHPVGTPLDSYFDISADTGTYTLKTDTAVVLTGGELQLFKQLQGATGLPQGAEQYSLQAKLHDSAIAFRHFERCVVVYDPNHVKDSPPGFGAFYLGHVADPDFGIVAPAPAPTVPSVQFGNSTVTVNSAADEVTVTVPFTLK